jgi:hypothetical protein
MMTVQQRALWLASLATRQKGDNNIDCIVAIDNATHKVYQISHHSIELRQSVCAV